LYSRIKVFQEDANAVVRKICDEIDLIDRQKQRDTWSTFNIAFLDPEGLELEWATVERLANIRKMDLIINFSTSGIIRSIGAGYFESVDRFFGNSTWQSAKDISDPIVRRRKLIEIYLNQLSRFGYNTQVDPDLGSHDVMIRNSKNAEVYSLIFASKNELGDKFWRTATTNPTQPKLL
jgi:three-Cys-motif partner protein